MTHRRRRSLPSGQTVVVRTRAGVCQALPAGKTGAELRANLQKAALSTDRVSTGLREHVWPPGAFGKHPERMDATSDVLARLAAIDLDDSPRIARALFGLSWAAAHDRTDPPGDLAAFREALWEQLAAAFEWVPLALPGGVDLLLEGGHTGAPGTG